MVAHDMVTRNFPLSKRESKKQKCEPVSLDPSAIG